MLVRFRSVAAGIALLAVAMVLSVTITVTRAGAGPTDDFTLATGDDVGGRALIGEHVTLTLTATGSQSSGAFLYNLSFAHVLPPGTALISSDPAPTAVLADVPGTGSTTVIWENVSDLPAGSRSEVSLVVDTNPDFSGGTSGSDTAPVGSTLTGTTTAVASLNAFLIPNWDPATGLFTGDFDGQATASDTLDIAALRVTSVGPGELLRGVHGNGFGGRSGSSGADYGVRVENNPDYPLTAVTAGATLDPGLEFLGCDNYYPAADDNSTAVPFRESTAATDEEWAGSGPLATGTGPCDTPTSVSTVAVGGGGNLARTVVSWNVGDMTPGQVTDLVYRAGIPMRSNTTSWTTQGGAPTGALDQGRNLDNNSGPSTNELDRTLNPDPELLTDGAPSLAVTADAHGTYTPVATTVADTDTLTTESEDIVITKSSTGSLSQGTVVSTDLVVATGEYRDFTDLVIRDLLPGALCYLGTYTTDNTPGGSDWATNDCPGAGSGVGTAASVRELPDGGPYGTGRLELVWDRNSVPGLAALPSDSTITVPYTAVVRTDHRGGLTRLTAEPVLAGDEVTNSAEVSGPDFVVSGHTNDGGADDEAGGGVDGDTASASLSNSLPTIDKRVSAKTGPMADGAGVGPSTCLKEHGTITWQDTTATGFGPGDIVCFEIGATFPSLVDYENTVVADLLPPGYAYVTGSAARISGVDDLPGTTFDDTTLRWNLGTVDSPGHNFRWVIAARAGVPDSHRAADIVANLEKLTHNQNGGLVFQYRDQAPMEWAEPEVTLSKGVKAVSAPDTTLNLGPNPPDYDGSLSGGSTSVEIQADAVVTFRVDVTNGGIRTALNVEVRDDLPSWADCTMVSGITASGTCAAGQVSWTVPSLAPAGSTELNYDLTVPTTIAAGVTSTTRAGVRTYQTTTNTGTYDYFPRNNIDPAVTPNTDPADDPAFVHTTAPTLAKTQVSGIAETGNSSNGSPATTPEEATIGEIITYQVQLTVPDGTSLYGASVSDVLDPSLTSFTGQALFGGTVTSLSTSVVSADTDVDGDRLDGGTLVTPFPGINGTVTYTLPSDYRNAPGSGDDTVVITFHVQVASGTAGDTIPNSATLSWDDSLSGGPLPPLASNSVLTTVVEPTAQVVKAHTAPAGSQVGPGDTVTFEVTVSNPDPSGVGSPLHGLVVTDTVPPGLTPLGTGGVPVSTTGDAVPTTGVSPAGGFNGTWDQTASTITWNAGSWSALDTIDPGGSVVFTYQVQVDTPAVTLGTLTNTVGVSGSNLGGGDPNLVDGVTRTATDTDTLSLPAATIVKDIEPLGSPAQDRATVTVGEPLDFDVEVTIPAGTRAYDVTLFDQLPAQFTWDSFGTPVVGAACEAFSPTGALTPADIETFAPPVGGTTGRAAWFLGEVHANGADCVITLPYTVHVNSNAVDADTPTNGARLTWNGTDEIVDDAPTSLPAGYKGPGDGGWDVSTGVDSETITVVEPTLEIDRDVVTTSGSPLSGCDSTPGNNRTGSDDVDSEAGPSNGCDIEAGAVLRHRLRVTNSGTSDAHDATVTATVPFGMVPLTSPGGAPASDGGQVTGSTGSVGTWDQGARRITWAVVGPLAPGGGVTDLDFDTALDPSVNLTEGQDLTGTATVDSYFALDAATRAAIGTGDVPTYGNGATATRGSLLPDSTTVEVHFPQVTLAKTAVDDASDARLDTPFTWRLTATNGSAARAFDLDVVDTIPTGWSYVPGSAVVDTPYAGPVSTEPAISGSTLTWAGVVSGPSQPLHPTDFVTVTYRTRPDSAVLAPDPPTGTANTGAANPHVNTATAAVTDASGSASCCDTGGGPVPYSTTDTASAVIRRADLSLTKTLLDPPPIYNGDLVTYALVLTNDGPDTATGVVVTDTFAPDLVHSAVVRIDTGTYDPATGQWTVPSVGPGSSVELHLRMEVATSGTVTNTAEITAAPQWDPDSTPANADPAEDDLATVSITALDTSLGNRVWLDLDGDGVEDPAEPGIPGVGVYVSWTGPDSSLQVRSSTTDSDGNWNVSGLPVNTPLTVTVDPSDTSTPAGTGGAGGSLPPGLTPTWELGDGPAVTASRAANGHTTGLDHQTGGIVLTSSTSTYLDVDFGYRGINSLGDEVWMDLDGGGESSPEPGDPPLVGLDLSVTWAGFDGVTGNADDLTLSTTTDATGHYLFDGLPDGTYEVSVDPAGLFGGAVPTFDLDGVGTAHDSGPVDLGPSTPPDDRRDVDFAYTGAGSVGDTVWFDRDADGAVDPGEVGLAGLGVTGAYTLPGGGTVTLTTTTDGNGHYSFTGLPLDLPVTVTVDPAGLPAGFSPVSDPDGVATPHTAVVIPTTAQPVVTDADFGYAGSGSIGDSVWFDVDGDGSDTPAASDFPLPGTTVTLTWVNPTGGSDMTATATTDPSGSYLFANLPPGSYTVTLSPPAGTVATFDADGGGDLSSAVTLTDGQADLTHDFAVTGTASVGDTVWHDLDADGVLDDGPGGESGIGGVTLEVAWLDTTGTAIHTWTTITDGNGNYVVERLPAGEFSVTVLETTVPGGLAQVTDPDATLDGAADTTLEPGEAERGMDFGYRPQADLALDKSHTGDFRVGEDNTWTISVTNHGPAAAGAPVRVTDTLPEGISWVGSVGDDWSCDADGATVTCTLVGSDGSQVDLASGATATVKLTVRPDADVAVSVANTARVTSATADPAPLNDTDSDTVAIPRAVLSLAKTLDGTLYPGEKAVYELTVTNTGPSATNGPVTVTDDLPPGLRYLSAAGPEGSTCSASGQKVTCTLDSTIPLGEKVVFRIDTQVEAGTGDQIINTATVEGGSMVNGSVLPSGQIGGITESQAPGTVAPARLAFTGLAVRALLWTALSLLVVGSGLILGTRRRRI